MADITSVDFYEGTRELDRPTILLDAATARLAIDIGELDDLIEKALNALEMTGKRIVHVQVETHDA
jgi:hypothetical protein